MNICMVGTGYVGLVTGACLSDFGMDVTCVDKDEAKIALLKNGVSPIYEPGLEELIHKNEKAGRLRFSTDIAEAIERSLVIFIAVGTPPKDDGSPDLSFIFQVAESIARAHERLQGRRDEVDRADRHRRADRGDPQEEREAQVLGRLEPRVPPRGLGDRGLHAPGPRRDRLARRGGHRDREGRLLAARDRGRPVRRDGRRVGRAHQVRLERLPRAQDHVHQRDRDDVRQDGRRRQGRRARDGPRQAHRARSS